MIISYLEILNILLEDKHPMTTISHITRHLEALAPLAYQESYDNAGLITGEAQTEVTGILVSLDTTEEVVLEAVRRGCNLVVAHHPIVFGGLRKINRSHYVGRAIVRAIQNDIAIYAAHTNLDNVAGGVNFRIARQLGLQNSRILKPKTRTLRKLTVFVPAAHTEPLLAALHQAGAGVIGNYSECSFRTAGTGAFTPNAAAQPHMGRAGSPEQVAENRVEVMFPVHLSARVLAAMRQSHPYEEVAHYVQDLENENQEVGAGVVGTLAAPMEEQDFLNHLKGRMAAGCVRHTALRGQPVRTVAVCGGAGISLLPDAIRAAADVFVTADVKYHEFFEAEGEIILADIGHYESEAFTKDLISGYLSEKFPTIAVILAETVTNPVFYL